MTVQRFKKAASGFTLTELIMVIVIMGIISVVIGPLIANKFSAVAQSTERAKWVQQAEYAMFHLRQDLANSVPNSVFTSEPLTGNDQVIEFLSAPVNQSAYAGRYRDRQLAGFDRLQPNNDASFDLFGFYSVIPQYVSIGTANSAQMRIDWQNRPPVSNAGTISSILSLNALSIGSENGGPLTSIELTGPHDFGGHSPYFRAYFTNGPVGYECDTVNHILYRVSSYTSLDPALAATFAIRSAPATRSRVVDNLTSCSFELRPGSQFLPPLLNIQIGIGNGTENIQLLDTLMLSNGS